MDDIPKLILGLAFMASIVGVILLRPLTNRLADLLELMIKERRMKPVPEPRIRESLERLDERLRMVEERQDFHDALIAQNARARTLAPPQEAFLPEIRERS